MGSKWGDRTGESGRTELMAERKEAAETAPQRVRRVLIERLGGRSDIVMGVEHHKNTHGASYVLNTGRPHPSIEPERLPLMMALAATGLKPDDDFFITPTGGQGFAVTVNADKLESTMHRDQTVSLESVRKRLGVNRDMLYSVKPVPARTEPVFTINTSKPQPDFHADTSTLVAKLQGMGFRKDDEFSVEDRGGRSVTVTIKQSALEKRIPETAMPSRSASAAD